MVCENCQDKLKTVCVPDKWKEGARNCINSHKSHNHSLTMKTNKLLNQLTRTPQYLPDKTCCRLCRSKVQAGMNYCNDCAHKKGICAMCGRKSVDVSRHKMSLV